MDSSENKGRENVAYLNCFFRSLMFKRVATLPGIDSGLLFLKGIVINYIVCLAIIAMMSFLMDSFNLNVLIDISNIFLALGIIIIPLLFVVSVIFNVFLADGLMKITNIFLFSGSYSMLFSYIYTAIYTYKICVYKSVFRRIYENPKIIKALIVKINNQGVLTEWERKFLNVMNDILYCDDVMWYILYLFSVLAFIILLIRNIRALRRK